MLEEPKRQMAWSKLVNRWTSTTKYWQHWRVHIKEQETVQEFKQELQEFGVNADEGAEERAVRRRWTASSVCTLHVVVRVNTSVPLRRLNLRWALAKRLKKVQERVHRASYLFVVAAKAGWCSVLRLARENDVERRLHKRELAYLTAGELRSVG